MLVEISIFAFFVSHVFSTLHYVDVTSKRSLKVERLRGTILRLDEVLTMSARMAAASGDLKWEKRYRQFEPELDQAIKDAEELVPSHANQATAKITQDANDKLVDMENRSFKLVEIRHSKEALGLLLGDEYSKQKDIYAKSANDYSLEMQRSVDLTEREERTRANRSLAITAFGLLTLLSAWTTVLVSLRRWKRALLEASVEQGKTEEALHQVLSGARCLLWQAEVEETPFGLRCEISIQEEDSAWRWLQLTQRGDCSYTQSWSAARKIANGSSLEEDICKAVRSEKATIVHRFLCGDREGASRWLYEDISVERISSGSWRVIGACTDVTELKEAEERLEHQALHDVLTDLPNRQLVMERLASALERASGNAISVAVMFIDFDNFKVINDSLGHEAGDQFLLARVETIKQCIRPGDTLARLGGDEFLVILEGLPANSETIPSQIGKSIISRFQQPVQIQSQDIYSGVSIGIAVSQADCTAVSLIRDADTAMYHVKADGKSNYSCFHNGMNDRVNEQLEIESGLRAAVSRQEFVVHYQPLVDLSSGRIMGTEALVRWQHPEKGLIYPIKFIPVAEDTGLIIPIGYWVLHEACRQTKEWQDANPSEELMTISVNLSGRQLQRSDVVARVVEVLEATQLSPRSLKLEITESLMMKDLDETIKKLHELKAHGIQLAIDDFGTGYSSLASLVQLPIDTIKIDRAFVARLGRFPDANATIAALVALGTALNMDVTGEGVESVEQLEMLHELGCTVGQGFLFSKPISGPDLTLRLEEGVTSCQSISAA